MEKPDATPIHVVRTDSAEASLAALLKRLASQAGDLARQEAELAKTELRQSAQTTVRGVVLLAMGAVLLLLGALVLTAFVILLIGKLVGAYWPVALVAAVVYLAAGGLLALRAKSVFGKQALKPEHTLRSLATDRMWVKAEIEEARHQLA